MSRTISRLEPLTVEREKTIGRHADGGGLYLIVKPGPRRFWAFLYRRDTKTTELGLGSTSDVSLVAARAEATELRAVLSAGGDPKAHRERKRQAKALEDARSITFETAARNYHELHNAAWHSAWYVKSWLRVLELHAFPKIGNLSVGAIDLAARSHLGTSAMLDLLGRMGWNNKTITHGLRVAFKTWATERPNFPREVIELCLSHVQGDLLQRACQRGDIIEKRRQLMQARANYCETGENIDTTSNVVPLRA
jgi:hypothetical protein